MPEGFGQQQFGYAELIQAAPYLMVFHAVAEEPVIATVAERFDLNSDGIRYRLRKLEGLLETKLVATEYDRAILTARGEQLYGYSKSLLTTLTALDRNLRPMFAADPVAIGVDATVPERLLFNRFLVPSGNRSDGVTVSRGTSEDIRRQFFSGKSVEAALFVTASKEASKFGVNAPFPICWSVGAAFDRGRLSNLPVALPPRGSALRSAAIESLAAAAIDWHCAYDLSDLATLLEVVAYGHAVAVVPTDCIGGGVNEFTMLNKTAPVRPLHIMALSKSTALLAAHPDEVVGPAAKPQTATSPSLKTASPSAARPQVG